MIKPILLIATSLIFPILGNQGVKKEEETITEMKEPIKVEGDFIFSFLKFRFDGSCKDGDFFVMDMNLIAFWYGPKIGKMKIVITTTDYNGTIDNYEHNLSFNFNSDDRLNLKMYIPTNEVKLNSKMEFFGEFQGFEGSFVFYFSDSSDYIDCDIANELKIYKGFEANMDNYYQLYSILDLSSFSNAPFEDDYFRVKFSDLVIKSNTIDLSKVKSANFNFLCPEGYFTYLNVDSNSATDEYYRKLQLVTKINNNDLSFIGRDKYYLNFENNDMKPISDESHLCEVKNLYFPFSDMDKYCNLKYYIQVDGIEEYKLNLHGIFHLFPSPHSYNYEIVVTENPVITVDEMEVI